MMTNMVLTWSLVLLSVIQMSYEDLPLHGFKVEIGYYVSNDNTCKIWTIQQTHG